MPSLYVVGARQRKLRFKDQDEPHLYEAALILELDIDAGKSKLLVDYKSPAEARANDESSHVFKSGTLADRFFYACTSTEVLIFEVPSFRRRGYVSLPCFNDLHHVTPTQDGNLAVANTGLDMVVKFTPEGRILKEWSVLGDDPWGRFSKHVDYRKVASTKPHQSHPNFVFELGKEMWATRFQQRDAICLDDRSRTIDIAVEGPHDGLVHDGRIYFTTVDGKIAIANPHTLRVEETVDLHAIDNKESELLGWCRGVLPMDHGRVWAGFTRVRKTQFKENLLWIKHAFRETEKPTHIACYDLARKQRLQEFDLEQHGMNVVFGIYHVVPATSVPGGKQEIEADAGASQRSLRG